MEKPTRKGTPIDDPKDARALWLGVIRNAIIDACNPYVDSAEDKDLVRRTSEGWLNGKLENFEVVCSLAGVSPGVVRQQARRIIAHYRTTGDYPEYFRAHIVASYGSPSEGSVEPNGLQVRTGDAKVRHKHA